LSGVIFVPARRGLPRRPLEVFSKTQLTPFGDCTMLEPFTASSQP